MAGARLFEAGGVPSPFDPTIYDRPVGDDDRPRLLAKRSELGYVDRVQAALAHEPEAISAAELAHQTLLAHRRRAEQQRDVWSTARAMILQGTALARSSKLPKQVISDVRAVERVVGRIDSELQRGRP
jgi:hypothetical protein